MSDKPGFSVRKVDLDDDVIEIESNPEAEAEELVEIVELRELLDELREELKVSRRKRKASRKIRNPTRRTYGGPSRARRPRRSPAFHFRWQGRRNRNLDLQRLDTRPGAGVISQHE